MLYTPLWRWLGTCLLCWSSLTSAAELAPVPTLNTAVTDLTQTLTAEQVATLEQQLRDFSTRKRGERDPLAQGLAQPGRGAQELLGGARPAGRALETPTHSCLNGPPPEIPAVDAPAAR